MDKCIYHLESKRINNMNIEVSKVTNKHIHKEKYKQKIRSGKVNNPPCKSMNK